MSKRRERTEKGNIPSVPSEIVKKTCISVLNRCLWSRWHGRLEVKNRCRRRVLVGKFKNGNPKYKNLYECEECSAQVERIDVDHIEPRIGGDGLGTLDEWVARTFVDACHLRGLCKECHARKTAAEATMRAEVRKEKRESGGTKTTPAPERRRKRKGSKTDSD